MMLAFTEGLMVTTPFDQECRMLADRHYSRRKVGNFQFCGPGKKLVLRDWIGQILFVWTDEKYRLDNQTGYNCSIFRNESTRRSSEIILEAEEWAVKKWGPNRFYTYVDTKKIKSRNPGYCFKMAGWKEIGKSKKGLILLAKSQ